MSPHFRDKDVVCDSIKYFALVQADDISCSSLIHKRCNPMVMLNWAVAAKFLELQANTITVMEHCLCRASSSRRVSNRCPCLHFQLFLTLAEELRRKACISSLGVGVSKPAVKSRAS